MVVDQSGNLILVPIFAKPFSHFSFKNWLIKWLKFNLPDKVTRYSYFEVVSFGIQRFIMSYKCAVAY